MTMSMKLLAGAAFAAAFALAAPLRAEPVTITHSKGELTLEKAPEKVLILDINTLDIADAMGFEPAGVVGTNLPPYLTKFADAAKYPAVGTLFEPDYETIAAMDADLMISGGRSAKAWPELSALMPTIDLSLGDEHIPSIRHNITELGKVFGMTDKATGMVAAVDTKLADVKAKTSAHDTALVLVVNGAKLGAYGPKSRVGWIHTELGFQPLEENIDDRFHGGDVISFEYILEKNPKWIFVIDRDAGVGNAGAGAMSTLDNAIMAQTDAVKNGRMIMLDPASAYVTSGGYTAIMTLLDQIGTAVAEKG